MTTIAPNDANIWYSPGCWDVTSTRAMTINYGARIKAVISSAPADLVAVFTLAGAETRRAIIEYRVNEGPWVRTLISANTPLPLPQSRTWPVTTVEIAFEWSGSGLSGKWTNQTYAFAFAGFSSASTITTRPAAHLPSWLLAVGDSLSIGVLALTPSVPDAAVTPFLVNSPRLGWGPLLAEALGMEAGVQGFGGVGLSRSGDDSVPAFGTLFGNLWNGKPATYSTAPALIAFMPGTNDSAGTDAAVTAAAVSWLNAALTKFPDTPIALIRNLRGIKAAAISAAIPLCSNPDAVTWIDTTGWNTSDSSDGYHPYGYSYTVDVVPRLAADIAPLLTPAPANERLRWSGTAWV